MGLSAERHWGLARAPFDTVLDPAFFFPSEDHVEALARLRYLVEEPGNQIGVLTGEIGCGKSLTRSLLASRLASSCQVAQLSSSHYPFRDLLRALLGQLGAADPGPDAVEMDLLAALRRQTAGVRRPTVLVFDEAQEMDQRALVGVRALDNLADGALGLKLILVGQPELRETVASLPQIDQRIGLRYHLRPLPDPEVADYLGHRLKVAGHATGELFEAAAAAAVATLAAGVPRQVNRCARLAMAVAAGRGAAVVEAADVELVARDLERQQARPVA